MHSPEIIHRKVYNRVCHDLVHLIRNKTQSYQRRGRHQFCCLCCHLLLAAEQDGYRTKSIHRWFGHSGLYNGQGSDSPRTIFISVQDSVPGQDKHLVRWILCCNCPPFSQAMCQQGEKQTFRQGYKMALLKVPEGWSNTNFTESRLKVSDTWAFKSFWCFSYKLPSVLEILIC